MICDSHMVNWSPKTPNSIRRLISCSCHGLLCNPDFLHLVPQFWLHQYCSLLLCTLVFLLCPWDNWKTGVVFLKNWRIVYEFSLKLCLKNIWKHMCMSDVLFVLMHTHLYDIGISGRRETFEALISNHLLWQCFYFPIGDTSVNFLPSPPSPKSFRSKVEWCNICSYQFCIKCYPHLYHETKEITPSKSCNMMNLDL